MDLEEDLHPILGDASALIHVLMNLCVNAVDAMPESGTLRIRTLNVDSGWVEVQVEDTGIGMPKEVLEKAFDPFFTTKESGKGTGLGLSIAHSTVLAHHGRMDIQSAPGHGTRVSLRFPACEPGIQAPEAPPVPERRLANVSLKVLLVDDDELIQSPIQEILDMLGHAFVTARVDQSALDLASAHPGVTLLAKPFGMKELQQHLGPLGRG